MEPMKRIFCCLLAILCLSGCTSSLQEKTESVSNQTASVSSQQQVKLDEQETVRPEKNLPLEGKVICVDPGHEVTNLREQEPINPYSSETKEAFVGGTTGKNQTEEQLNLSVGLKLQALLEKQGATVVMTRTTHESDMTSYKRAKLANEKQADLCIRIHADGSTDSSVHGMSMLVPYGEQLASQAIVEPSRLAGECVLTAAIKATGAKNNGIVQRSDLTGFNFAEVPTILIEMGFMSNPEEDALMETQSYQDQLTQGVCDGIIAYFADQKNNE